MGASMMTTGNCYDLHPDTALGLLSLSWASGWRLRSRVELGPLGRTELGFSLVGPFPVVVLLGAGLLRFCEERWPRNDGNVSFVCLFHVQLSPSEKYALAWRRWREILLIFSPAFLYRAGFQFPHTGEFSVSSHRSW